MKISETEKKFVFFIKQCRSIELFTKTARAEELEADLEAVSSINAE